MPLFVDLHNHIEGLPADGAEKTHRADLKAQANYGVNYRRFWFDEETGNVFCLIEAPNNEAAVAVHQEAHGLLADELIEVKECE